jgi:hypothetical protein
MEGGFGFPMILRPWRSVLCFALDFFVCLALGLLERVDPLSLSLSL